MTTTPTTPPAIVEDPNRVPPVADPTPPVQEPPVNPEDKNPFLPPVETPKEDETTPPADPTPPTEEEPKVEEEEENKEDNKEEVALDTDVWGDTGSDVGNNTLTVLQNAGVTTEEAKAILFDAVSSGDIDKIDTAALEAKVGKSAAAIILTGTKAFIKEAQEKTAAIKNTVYEAAGGESNWDTIIKWTKSSNTDISEYAEMIDRGGAAARFAVAEITGLYNADAKNTAIEVGKPQRAEPTSSAAPAVEPITRIQFAEQLDDAHQRGDQKAVDRIKAARRAGRKLGI